MSDVLNRLKKYRGLDKDKQKCPSNTCISVREAIEIADYIAELEGRLSEPAGVETIIVSDDSAIRKAFGFGPNDEMFTKKARMSEIPGLKEEDDCGIRYSE